MREAAVRLAALDTWDVTHVEAVVRSLPEELGVKPKAVFAALRLGMSGQSITPGLFESLWALGQDEAVGPAHDGGGPALRPAPGSGMGRDVRELVSDRLGLCPDGLRPRPLPAGAPPG